MKPPSNMPLPWTVSKGYRDGYILAVIFDKDGNFHEDATPEDREQSAAYIQHCVNNYPVLVDLLSHIRDWCEEHGKEPFWLVYVEEALRKAGE